MSLPDEKNKAKLSWFDSHCHLDRLPPEVDLSAVLQRADEAGVEQIIVPGVCGAVQAHEKLLCMPEVGLAWGFHPGWIGAVANLQDPLWAEAGYWPVAIGECGLDKRYEQSGQEAALVWQLELALAYNLPVIMHLVGCYQRAFDLLAAMPMRPKFVLHSWSGSAEMALRFVKLGGSISLSGGILRRNSLLTRVLELVPLTSLLLETDAPDMAPSFWPSTVNEPAALPLIGAAMAEIAGFPVEKLAEIMYNNARNFFYQGSSRQHG